MAIIEDDERKRLDLIRNVYRAVHDATESFEPDDIGMHLAYLLGVIATGEQVDFGPDSGAESMLAILREAFPDTAHPVWQFISED